MDSERRRITEIIKILEREYPDARCSLDFNSPFQLLVATILSAQCTDERVNRVTPALFKKFPDSVRLAKADIRQLEALIRSAGFYKSKARALKECSQALVKNYGGEVPRTMEALVELRGVGRKTANVVLGNCFDVPGVAVDTHMGRLSRRLGISKHADPEKVEKDIEKLVPKDKWSLFSHLIISHGRAICTARRPLCPECPINRFCPKIGVATQAAGRISGL
ncbi:MAG: endonuclease III [Bdellovibrionales bacterium GWB1_52_6]|nr:MAG: endonuclease III [Bdellovibrionales bacterium GWB1_52_6]OFZ05007.1 MAG: endonuclease III [Bdellovibrionales bacterium GWA1_52_35]HCM41239.1 endonuclease III [Bdellovibrionales bacterium]